MSENTFEAALEAAAQEVPTPEGEESAPAVDVVVEEENDPQAEFRRALRSAPGDWYVIHSYAGYENRVKGNLENRIHTLNMEDYIYQRSEEHTSELQSH